MPDNVTQIQTRLRVPGVPRSAAVRPLTGGAQALRSVAGAVEAEGRANASVGRALTNVGVAAQEVAVTFEKARQTQSINKATNAGLERLNDLSTELEQDTDFATAEERFNEGATKIRSEIEGGLVTPRERRQFGDKFDSLRIVRKARVQRQVFSRQRDATRATLAETLGRLSREASNADSQGARDAVGLVAKQAIDAVAEDGFINRQTAGALARKFRSDATEFAMRELITNNPKAAAAILADDKKSEALDPGVRAKLQSMATTQTRIRDNQVKAEQNRQRASLKADVRDILSIAKEGVPVSPELMARARGKAEALKDKASVGALKAAEDIFEFQRSLAVMTPVAAQAELNKLQAGLQSGATRNAAAKLKAGRQVLARMNRELARDPLSFATQTGVLQVAPIELGGQVPAEAFTRRKAQALAVAEHYNVPAKFFTDEERTTLANRFKSGSPEERRGIVTALTAGFGNQAAQALSEISVKAPAASHLGGLQVLGPQHLPTVRDGFRGLEAIENKTVELPAFNKLRDVVDEELGGALDSRLVGVRRNVLEAAKAIYAARALDRQVTDFDEDLFRQSVRNAAGEYEAGGEARGGVASFNGHDLLLPQHMTENQFAAAVRNMGEVHLKRLSAGGGLPIHRTIRGQVKKARPEDFRDAFFVTVGPGLYQVSMTDPQVAPQFLIDEETGRFYVLDLSDPGETPTAPAGDAADPGALAP